MEQWKKNLKALQQSIKYEFKDVSILETALTHPSINLQFPQLLNYERLEFLGDRVLGLVIAELLFENFSHESEGELARRHAGLVCGSSIHRVAKTLQIADYLRFSATEDPALYRDNASVLENALEALIGAIYLDSGLAAAQQFIRFYWHPLLASVKDAPKDAKTALQEWAQAQGLGLPVYDVLERSGPDHAPRFTIRVRIGSNNMHADAIGNSKKEAEQGAAAALLASIE